MSFKAQTVPGSMDKVVTVASLVYHAPRRPIHLLTGYARPRSGQTRGVSRLNDLVHLDQLGIQVPGGKGARDIGSISLNYRAKVNQQ